MQPVLKPHFSLVIPVYRNAGSIHDLVRAVARLDAGLDGRLEVIFVVDGSPDDSHERLRNELPASGLDAKLILLSRNFGSFAAIREGLLHAQGEFAAVMAADLQEPPELVLEFFQRLSAGEGDIAFGVREARQDPLSTRMSAALFWWFYRKFVQRDVPVGGVDVFAVTRQFLERLLTLTEANGSLLGLLFWIGGRRIFVPYSRTERQHGKSAWTFRKKLTYLMDSVFAFTDAPIRILLAVGLAGLLTSMAMGALVLIAKLLGLVAVPGYTGTMLTLLFFGGLNAFGLGLVGNYAWRAYENTKQRPLSIPMLIEKYPRTRQVALDEVGA
ncbi:glycosyltransferase family 2 protein [Pseudoxanthomonas sp. CF125]|uniref:glycosyltransferase family 2 protein n=1 Tax=Pseudoxanthomonas sp. CF125 TaxID=1855303 RepID=UPI00088C9B3E|nr:glycosyltransferase family 2 protein [Pseudoxanthomonas sp. CF125]SDQ88901.1 Glycosyltransferase involved in cell wall bisynthesis [Pseudoxanthomonas sp. CF125]